MSWRKFCKSRIPTILAEMISDRRRLNLLPGSNRFTNSTLHLRRWTARNSFINDDDTFYIAVTHKAQTWARNIPAT